MKVDTRQVGRQTGLQPPVLETEKRFDFGAMISKAIHPSSPRHAAFARRLTDSFDNFGVPDLHRGRLGWVSDALEQRFGTKVSNETVRKWLSGEARPREDKMSVLAQLLMVDEAWLSLGDRLSATTEDRRVRDATAGGGVNLIAGMIQLAGGTPAFPAPGDASQADLFAIIQGIQYAFKVFVGRIRSGGEVLFEVSGLAQNVVVLGLIEKGPFQWDVVELDPDTVANHVRRKRGHGRLVVRKRGKTYTVGGKKLRQIEGFSQRL